MARNVSFSDVLTFTIVNDTSIHVNTTDLLLRLQYIQGTAERGVVSVGLICVVFSCTIVLLVFCSLANSKRGGVDVLSVQDGEEQVLCSSRRRLAPI